MNLFDRNILTITCAKHLAIDWVNQGNSMQPASECVSDRTSTPITDQSATQKRRDATEVKWQQQQQHL